MYRLNASNDQHFDDIRSLISEFIKWHLPRHSEDSELINEYFDAEDFEKELTSLLVKILHPSINFLRN